MNNEENKQIDLKLIKRKANWHNPIASLEGPSCLM